MDWSFTIDVASSIGTWAAVMVALFLPYLDRYVKRKPKLRIESNVITYLIGADSHPDSITVDVINAGEIPIQVSQLWVKMKGDSDR